MLIIFFLVSFSASTIGAISGIGGGVIIKPVLDLLRLGSISTISFLSGCTVLSMVLYSVIKNLLSGDNNIDLKTATYLAIGGSIGGVLGKNTFTYISANSNSIELVGALQSAVLAAITFGALIYTIFKQRIKTYNVKSGFHSTIIGLGLGAISSFIGIGGGPINIVVLYFFFSMDSKQASQNSLYIILFSQATNLISTLITRSVPPFDYESLILMVTGGIIGGIAGRRIYKKINNRSIEKLLITVIVIIIITSIYNTYRYLMPAI